VHGGSGFNKNNVGLNVQTGWFPGATGGGGMRDVSPIEEREEIVYTHEAKGKGVGFGSATAY
jgi:hypothetical protein